MATKKARFLLNNEPPSRDDHQSGFVSAKIN